MFSLTVKSAFGTLVVANRRVFTCFAALEIMEGRKEYMMLLMIKMYLR